MSQSELLAEKKMTENRDVWVFIEQADGQIADVSLELLAKAGELAQILGSQVVGLLFGHHVDGLAEKIISEAMP